MFSFRLVIETLDKVDKDRRCFRLVGGVLVERKVGEVEPALIGNKDKVSSLQQSKHILQGLIRIKINEFIFCKTLTISTFVKSANLYSPFIGCITKFTLYLPNFKTSKYIIMVNQ